MKLLFLDIDGVLNSTQSVYYYSRQKKKIRMETLLCPIATSNLQHILEKHPDCQIVISSTWRKYYTLKQFKKIFDYYKIDSSRIIGITPINKGSEIRGKQIAQWFSENPQYRFSHFVIIDDDGDMEQYLNTHHFVQTSSKSGLMWSQVEEVLKYFGDYTLKFSDIKIGTKYRLFSKPEDTLYEFDGEKIFYIDNQGVKHNAVFFYPETELFSEVIDN